MTKTVQSYFDDLTRKLCNNSKVKEIYDKMMIICRLEIREIIIDLTD